MWAGVFGADRAMSGRGNKCSLRRRKEEDYRPSIELVLGPPLLGFFKLADMADNGRVGKKPSFQQALIK